MNIEDADKWAAAKKRLGVALKTDTRGRHTEVDVARMMGLPLVEFRRLWAQDPTFPMPEFDDDEPVQ